MLRNSEFRTRRPSPATAWQDIMTTGLAICNVCVVTIHAKHVQGFQHAHLVIAHWEHSLLRIAIASINIMTMELLWLALFVIIHVLLVMMRFLVWPAMPLQKEFLHPIFVYAKINSTTMESVNSVILVIISAKHVLTHHRVKPVMGLSLDRPQLVLAHVWLGILTLDLMLSCVKAVTTPAKHVRTPANALAVRQPNLEHI